VYAGVIGVDRDGSTGSWENRSRPASAGNRHHDCERPAISRHYCCHMSVTLPEPRRELLGDRQSLADLIFGHLLRLIETGDLQPGQRLNDLELAESLGYSRTPVREAVQRLRSIGVVESSAQRYTRIVEVSPEQMQHCLVVWVALAHTLVREIMPVLGPEDFSALKAFIGRFTTSRKAADPRATALAAFRFAEYLTLRSENPELRRAIESVVYVIFLGSLELPAWLDAELIEAGLHSIVDGLQRQDLDAMDSALEQLSHLNVVNLSPIS
jgi:DNA-binding GntR family transcriptional regulator